MSALRATPYGGNGQASVDDKATQQKTCHQKCTPGEDPPIPVGFKVDHYQASNHPEEEKGERRHANNSNPQPSRDNLGPEEEREGGQDTDLNNLRESSKGF